MQGSAIPTFFSISHREMGNTGIPGNSGKCKTGSGNSLPNAKSCTFNTGKIGAKYVFVLSQSQHSHNSEPEPQTLTRQAYAVIFWHGMEETRNNDLGKFERMLNFNLSYGWP